MMSIGQLAGVAGVSNRTLRYYEELGLIVPKARGENRYRYYDDSHIQRINTIKMLQDGGFALKEIVAALVPLVEGDASITYLGQDVAKKIFDALGAQRARLVERQVELTRTLEEIQTTMNGLQNCFGCRVSARLEDCAQCTKGPSEVTHLGSRVASGDTHPNIRVAAGEALLTTKKDIAV